MDYSILQASDCQSLENNVKRYIRNGWVPCGGVSTYAVGYSSHFVQAMMKTKGD